MPKPSSHGHNKNPRCLFEKKKKKKKKKENKNKNKKKRKKSRFAERRVKRTAMYEIFCVILRRNKPRPKEKDRLIGPCTAPKASPT